MKIAVVGAGAMGCLYGCYLSKENDVTLLDVSKPQVEAINARGVILHEKDGVNAFPLKAALSGEAAGEMDLALVFVKSTQTFAAMEQNRGLIGRNTIVMTLQNGAGNDRDILHFVSRSNIVVGTSKHNCVSLGPGEIRHTARGATTLGAMDPSSDRGETAAKILRDAGMEAVVSNDIQRVIWDKLFVNLSINALTALLETRIGYMVKNDDAWSFARRVIYEAVDVAEADGVYFDRRETLEMVRKVCVEAADGYSSMYQDRKGKRLTEIDRMNGAVVDKAKRYGVPTPYNALIVDLIHAIEGAYGEDG